MIRGGILLSALAASVAGVAFGRTPQLMAYRSFDPELRETRAFADMGVKLRAFGVCNTYTDDFASPDTKLYELKGEEGK